MPGAITGIDFLESIKKDPVLSHIPVIMLTASDRKDEILRGLNAGARDYITKPFDPEKLKLIVRGAVEPETKHILLHLSDKKMEARLTARLTQIDCRVLSTLTASATEIEVFLRLSPLAVIFDFAALERKDITRQLRQIATCPSVCLLPENADLLLAPKLDNMSVIKGPYDDDLIIQQTTGLMASQRVVRR